MIHGTLVVTPADHRWTRRNPPERLLMRPVSRGPVRSVGEPAAAEVEAAQAEERRAEIADLTRRVVSARC